MDSNEPKKRESVLAYAVKSAIVILVIAVVVILVTVNVLFRS